MKPFTPSTKGASTTDPAVEPLPMVIEAVDSGVPAELNPYSLPSEQPTKTFSVTKSRIGPVNLAAQETVTAPAVPQVVSRLGAAFAQLDSVQKTFFMR